MKPASMRKLKEGKETGNKNCPKGIKKLKKRRMFTKSNPLEGENSIGHIGFERQKED